MSKKIGHRRVVSMSGAEDLKFKKPPAKSKIVQREAKPLSDMILAENIIQTKKPTNRIKSNTAKLQLMKEELQQRSEELQALQRSKEDEIERRDKIIVKLADRLWPKYPSFFRGIQEYLNEKAIDLPTLCSAFTSNAYVDLQKLASFIDSPLEYELQDPFAEGIPFEALKELYRNFSSARPVDKEIFDYVSMNAQLLRVPKSAIPALIRGKKADNDPISQEELRVIFMKSPFKLTHPERLSKICEFLEDKSVSCSIRKFMKQTEDWVVFNSDQEEEFDKELYILISKSKLNLKKLCESHDSEKSGIITQEQFEAVLDELGVSFGPDLLRYLSVLFFAYLYECKKVPYEHFIKSYSQPIEDFELAEEEKAGVVRGYLEIIADVMMKESLTIKSAFINNDGYISRQDFLDGLTQMGIRHFCSEALDLLVESLQYDEKEEPCLSLEEMEELFEYYGVKK